MAIFLPFCELGDLTSYVVKWKSEQRRQRKTIQRISEVTIWKCLHDMVLALDYLHNKCENYGYTHNDIKPDNILVEIPKSWKMEDGIPDEPIFRLTDFARMTREHPTESAQLTRFCSTPEYAPPFNERGALRPSGDIWALGGTLQILALGVYPIQSHEAFSDSRRSQEKFVPHLIDKNAWKKSHWRHLIPTTFRPLSATKEELINDFDVHDSIVIEEFYPNRPWEHKPYSKRLDRWYQWMFEKDEKKRATAKILVRYCVPAIARKILVAREEERALECFERAKALRDEIVIKQQSRVAEV
ncbi:kinase-like protein [Alternaria alternata]|uniref:Kinase-like protein n=1 Tax=Alternaria alternata TaxID=5599 RepID=A0A177E1Z5_ALTAL|nr:kinase-like protein [Alternaria alternata]OAG25450.1 kinase-like protein [Alternaria alternata]